MAASTRPPGALPLLGVLLLVPTALGQAPRSCPANELNCNACPSTASGANILNQLPRASGSGSLSNSNIGEYDVLKCKDVPVSERSPRAGDTCPAGVELVDQAGQLDSAGSPPAHSAVIYAEGVALYPAVAVLAALLSLAFLPLFCFLRYCCCCAKGCSTCGKRYPSQTCCCRCCCCLCSCCNRCTFKVNEELLETAEFEDPSPHKLIRYPRGQRFCAFFCMTVFLVFVAVFILLGMLNGVTQIPTAAKAVGQSPQGVAELVRSPLRPVANFVSSAVGVRMVDLLEGMREALQSVDLRDLFNKLVCTKKSLDGLPRPDTLLGLVEDINRTINLLPDSQVANAELSSLNHTVVMLPILVTRLQGPIKRVEAALPALTDPAISTQLVALNASVAAIKPFPASTLKTFNEIDRKLPSADDVAGPPSSLHQRLADLTNNIRGNQTYGDDFGRTYRGTLESDLRSTATNFTTMPSVSDFADNLVEFNNTLDELERSVGNISHTVDNVQRTVDNLPDFGGMITTVNTLDAMIEGLSLDGVRSILVNLNTSVNSVPDLGLFKVQFDKIRGMADALNCTFAVVDLLGDINDTLVELPGDQFDSIADAVDGINSTLQDALTQIDDLQGNIDDFNNTLSDLPDFDSYVADIDAVAANVNSTKDSVNFTSLVINLRNVKAQTNVSFSSLNSTIVDLQTTLSDPDTRPSASMVANLRSLNRTQVELPPALNAAADGLQTFGNGTCVNSPTTSCLCDDIAACLGGNNPPYKGPSSACDGDDCNMLIAGQVDRCSPSPAGDTTVVACQSDDDCSSPSVCSRVKGASSVLGKLVTARENIESNPDSAGIKSQLQDMDQNLDDMPNLDDKIEEANSISSSAGDLQSEQNLTDVRGQLEDVKQSTADVPDTGSLQDDYSDMTDSVDKFDLSDTRKTLTDFNGTINDMPTDTIDSVLDSLNGTVELIYDKLPGYLTSIGQENLEETMFKGRAPEKATTADVDLAGGLKVFVDVMEQIITEFADLPSLFGTLRNNVLPRIRNVQSEKLLRMGPVYYLLVVGDIKTVKSPGPDAEVLQNAEGTAYKDTPSAPRLGNSSQGAEDLCLTSSCINNTVNSVWSKSLEDAGAPAAVSTEMALLVIYLPFLIIALCGCCSCTLGVKCNRWNPAICMVLLGCVMLPYLLLVTGVGLFVPAVMAADGCQSMEDLGQQYVRGERSEVCSSWLGGMPQSDGSCFLNIQNATGSSPAINATVDPVALYEDLFSHCSTSKQDATNNPFKRMYRSMGAGFAGYPEDVLGEDTLDSLGVKLRPKLKDPILNNTKAMGTDVATFFDDLGQFVACEEFRSAFYGFKDAFCCNVVGTFSWIAFSLWILTWSLFCCGICAGLYGRKRFPNKLWGPEFEKLSRDYGFASGAAVAPFPRAQEQLDATGESYNAYASGQRQRAVMPGAADPRSYEMPRVRK